MFNISELDPEVLARRYALLCESTRPEPDEALLPYSVEQAIGGLEKLLRNDLKALSLNGAPDDFSDIAQALDRELERLREYCAIPALGDKFVVAFGGGFSAGKSSLINTLLGRKLLVTEVDPTTSLPTYVLHGERDEVSALNLFGHRVRLTEADFLSLTHDEPLRYGSHISRLLRAAFVSQVSFPWPNLAIIDTPGYSKDGEGTHSERTDAHLARTQLNAAHAIVWVVDSRQGCITEDDLAFLATLRRDIPLFIAISRADQKPADELPGIQRVIADALQQRQIPVIGMAAVSTRKPRAWPLDLVHAQLQRWNEQPHALNFVQAFQAEFQRFDRFLAARQDQAQEDVSRLNRILALGDHPDAHAEALALKDQIQTQNKSLVSQAQQLEALWHNVGEQLQLLGKQVGMELALPTSLRTETRSDAKTTTATSTVTSAAEDTPGFDAISDQMKVLRQVGRGFFAIASRVSTKWNNEAGMLPKELIGSIYVQDNTVGLASYHFEADDRIYINWNQFPGMRFDNKKKAKTKHFSKVGYDRESRKFTGVLDFSFPERTTMHGEKQWVYEFTFSDDFETISHGTVTRLDNLGRVMHISRYGKTLHYRRWPNDSASWPFPAGDEP